MSKKYIYVLLFLFVSVFYFYTLFFWKWTFIYNAGDFLKISLIWNNINIKSLYWDSAKWISYIDYSINNNSDIYLSVYVKFFKLLWNPKNHLDIVLPEIWKYKIYYKNPDWSLDFIKEIEYK